MGKLLTAVWYFFCAVAVMPGCQSGERHASKVQQIVNESIERKSASECPLLAEDALADRDVPEALAYIRKHPDYTFYLLLMALRWYFPASYNDLPNEDKAAILCSALKNTTYLNDWGTLEPSGSFDLESANALLATGRVGLKCLVPILHDDSPTPLWGTQEPTLSHFYRYRRKDFAYRYASLILGKTPVFRVDPKERDKDIETLKAELKRHAK